MNRLFKTALTLSLAVQFVLCGCTANTIPDDTSNPITENEDLLVSDNSSLSDTESTASVLPNVTGKWIGEAIDILDELGVKYEIIYEPVKNVEEKRVISQTPNEGEQITSDLTVKLVVSGEGDASESKTESKTESKSESKQESKVESKSESKQESKAESKSENKTQKMPDIVGMELSEATSKLDSMGIYYKGSYEYNDSVPKGQIVSQSPAAGTDAPKGSNATFIISDGKQPEQPATTYVEEPTQDYNEPANEPSNEPAAEPDMSGVDKYLGSWYSFRPTANIKEDENGKYLIIVRWSGSATEGVMWSFRADYDPYNDTLNYTDGLEIPSYYDTQKGEWVGIGPSRYDLSGYFQINGNGELLWYDDGVDGSSDIVFQKY